MTNLEQRFHFAIDQSLRVHADIDEAAVKCSEITLEMMEKFAEWMDDERYERLMNLKSEHGKWRKVVFHPTSLTRTSTKVPAKFFTTKQLIDLFLKSQEK